MRHILVGFLLMLFLMPKVVYTQTQEEPKTKEPTTKLEAFLAKKGRLIVKEFVNWGK